MEITLSTNKYDHTVPEVIHVPVSRRISRVAPASPTADSMIIPANGNTSWDFTENVPAGYTFVSYVNALLKDVTGVSRRFYYGEGAKVYCANKSNTIMYATGHEEGDLDHYYYTISATLICVRSDLLPQEETP